ncbi:methylmalonyl-CoA mutase family protein [Rhizobium tubonense]|uniref:Methylmalonyl-CoA mutase n=1 Tax=Rhizobium tubonense TaxID=484088 RepID=A0A2W4D5A7_9HYPH|nr:methylmalonyl-CoA mutase family protein [Rhizobium tubonense]PZM17215.1 methylmalonyl-CoA mutase [Rhizobium tubonense]
MDADILDPQAFAATDHEAWLKLVGKALKGADFAETLVSATDDGIAIQPLYARRADATPMMRRRPLEPWTVTQRMDDPDTERAFAQLADDRGNGASGISLVMKDSPSAFGLGLDVSGVRDIPARLADASSDKNFSLRIEAGSHSAELADHVVAAMAGTAHAVHFGLDPLSAAALSGGEADLGRAADRFRHLQAVGVSGTILNADGRPVHNAGGTEAQELAIVAAAVAEYLRVLDADGIAPDTMLGAISLCLSADQDQFVTIAKARAARLIFARLSEACGCDPSLSAHLFMETSYRMLTRLDPETNILRNTIAVFAAGTGGADEISVLPYTLAHGIPDPLARRLARNTQVVLIAESHLDHVNDPAAGAGGVEALTDALAETAWEIFGDIERRGGLSAAIGDGSLKAMIARSREKRPNRLIVGTTLFPAKVERPVEVLGPLVAVDVAGLKAVRLDEEMGI